MQFDDHSIAALFPLLNPGELDDLADDIRRQGLLEPIWLFEGKILDGRNRYRACTIAGVEVRSKTFNGTFDEAIDFSLSLNEKRRHLTASQRAMVALEVEKLRAERAKERRREALEARRDPETGKSTSTSPKVGVTGQATEPASPRPRQEAAREAAAIMKVSHSYVSDAKAVAAKAPELVESVKSGTMTLPEAKKLAALPVVERRAALDKLDAGEVQDVRQAVASVQREKLAITVATSPYSALSLPPR